MSGKTHFLRRQPVSFLRLSLRLYNTFPIHSFTLAGNRGAKSRVKVLPFRFRFVASIKLFRARYTRDARVCMHISKERRYARGYAGGSEEGGKIEGCNFPFVPIRRNARCLAFAFDIAASSSFDRPMRDR